MTNRCLKCGQEIIERELGFKKAMKRMYKLMKKWHKEDINESLSDNNKRT